jgi:hypothetical protein
MTNYQLLLALGRQQYRLLLAAAPPAEMTDASSASKMTGQPNPVGLVVLRSSAGSAAAGSCKYAAQLQANSTSPGSHRCSASAAQGARLLLLLMGLHVQLPESADAVLVVGGSRAGVM